jgi:DNA mismatch repair protein MutS
MEKEYLKLYKHYSEIYGQNTCIFLMVGKFYEMYDRINKDTGEPNTSMLRAVELLNIQLTPPNPDKGKDYYFAGVPEQSLHKYAAVLTKHNWTVVVCDQVKNDSGKVVERPAARILSPGTHYETATADAPYVAAIWLEERNWQAAESPAYAVVFFDLTTGITTGFQGVTTGTADVWSADTLVQAIQIHNPREIVVFWRGDTLSRPNDTLLRSRIGGPQALLHVRNASPNDQGAFEKELVRHDFLKRHYAPKTMLPILNYLHLQDSPLTERALICLLRFIEDHIPSVLEHLQAFVPWTPKGRVHLGNNALTQLNMTTQRVEDSVLGLFSKTITPLGKRAIRNRILTPISDIEVLEGRYRKIAHLQAIQKTQRQQLDRFLQDLYDFPRIHRKILTYTVSAADILQLDQSYGRMKDLAVMFHGTEFEMPTALFEQFLVLRKAFLELFDLEKAKTISSLSLGYEDMYCMKDGVAPETAKVETELRAIREDIQDHIRQLAEWASLNPADLWIESGRETQAYSIAGKQKELNKLKTILSRRVTDTKTDDKIISVTVRAKQENVARLDGSPLPDLSVVIKKTSGGSVESPYLEAIHWKVLALRKRLHQEGEKELATVCLRLAEKAEGGLWDFLESWVSEIDMSLCIAKVSEARAFCRPTLLQNETCASLEVEGLRHPLIEASASRVQYIQHSVSLGTNTNSQGWLVYGMNASGKSSLMKAVGIATLLAQAGAYVPATSFKLAPFRAVLTRILNQDNLWAGLSSFAVEMSELRDILWRADAFSLVLGDELCSGTESVSATALVASGIEHLLKRQSRFIFATHLHGLMDLPQIAKNKQLGIWHLKVNYDAARDILVYDRTLHEGPGASIYGIEVARALHLPPDFLETAMKTRRAILGEKTEEESTGSAWNPNIIRKACEICGNKVVRNLEVHHIRERKEAKGAKHFADGSARDAVSNLAVLCEICHDKHHAGKLEIQAMVQTSAGEQRLPLVPKPTEIDASTGSESDEKDERKMTILNTLQKQPNVPLRRIKYELETNYGIIVSEATLRKFRKA